ncbi:M56 family metallopeptidase [Altererythrobacter aquiaggeris]|uniref:M56 family metallopeptidase n=1 Tax=Aestuarierythrobacter aquiaggeris TaxID=1898396 RepID=UPI0030180B71
MSAGLSQWLLDTALWTGIIIAFVLLVRRPVSHLFGASAAYALWALPFLRLILPPITLPAAMAPASEAASVTVSSISASHSGNVAGSVAGNMAPYVAGNMAPYADHAAAIPQAIPFDWTGTILSVWLAAACAFLAWRIVQYRKMRGELLHDAIPVGETGDIRLVETPKVAAPVAFGLFDRIIALPPEFMHLRDRKARDLALAHEVAHHRGGDILANFLAQLVLALHWFNPLAWLGWRAMRRDQEAACDARVMAGRSAEERARYGQVIASFAAGHHLALAAPMACPVLGEKSIIHRLRSLNMNNLSRRRRIASRLLMGSAALALPLTASVSYAEAPATIAAPAATIAAPIAAPARPDAPPAPPVSALQDGPQVEAEIEIEPGTDDAGPGRTWVIEDEDVGEDGGETGEVRKIRKAYVIRGGERLSDEDMEEVMADVRESMEDAREAMGHVRKSMEKADGARAKAEIHRKLAVVKLNRADGAITTVRKNCTNSGSTAHTSHDGEKVTVVCSTEVGPQALTGLRAARNSLAKDTKLDKETRDQIVAELDREIAKMSKED